jgi:molybdopterin-biosynthesis enzyme MoeA-like protein
MTLRGVALGLGRRLRLNEEALNLIREHYARRGLELKLTPARRKMAILPTGAMPLLNPVGTAPGVRLQEGQSVVYCLPGVPSEMRSIFRRSVEPEVKDRIGTLFRRAVTMKIEGIYESAMAPMIKDELERNPGAYIKSHPRGLREGVSRIELDIVVVKESDSEAKKVSTGIANRMIDMVHKQGGVVKSSKGLE